MFASGIYFQTEGTIARQVDLLSPLLRAWIGDDYLQHYRPQNDFFHYNPGGGGFSIAVKWNGGYGKSFDAKDRFRYCLTTIDTDDELTEEQHLGRMTQALELLWSHGIPTCTPGWTDELPHGGGEDGPVPWP